MSMIIRLPRESNPAHINEMQWHQSIGYARQACARIFRDGGTPAEALAAFGIKSAGTADWSRAVEQIAETLSTPIVARKAA